MNMIKDPYNRSDDFIYASIIVANNSQNVDNTMAAQGSFNSGFPIIQDASEYICRGQRLYISTSQLPLTIPDIQLGQSDPNLTTYSFALSFWNGSTYTYSNPVAVKYVPSSPVATTPAPPLKVQDLSTDYYYIYYYRNFLDMWYSAISQAFTQLKSLGLSGFPSTAIAPIPFFDPVKGLGIQYDSSANWSYPENGSYPPFPNTLQLYFNAPVKKFMNGMRYAYVPNTTACNYALTIQNDPLAGTATAPLDLYVQNIAEMCYWTSVRTIQIRSALLPAQYETSPAPVGIYGNQGTQSTNVVTDIQIDASASPVAYNIDVVYNNADILRVFNLTKKGPIQNIDAQIWWIDQYGRAFPLLIPYGTSCEIKYEFVRKDVYYGLFKTAKA